jgi:hypothetical protein
MLGALLHMVAGGRKKNAVGRAVQHRYLDVLEIVDLMKAT